MFLVFGVLFVVCGLVVIVYVGVVCLVLVIDSGGWWLLFIGFFMLMVVIVFRLVWCCVGIVLVFLLDSVVGFGCFVFVCCYWC